MFENNTDDNQASASSPTRTQCPKCHATVPVYEGFPTWCDQCGWNQGNPTAEPPRGRLQRLFEKWAKKQNRLRFQQVLRDASLPTVRKLTPARLVAYGAAGLVHSLTVAAFALGIWFLFLDIHLIFRILFAVICFLLSAVLFPRLHFSIPHNPLSREQFPGLYRLANEIAQALHCRPVECIAITGNVFNASMVRMKWTRRRYLDLGLPLLTVLSPQERVALIGHELAHTVVGDPFEELFVHAAMDSLRGWIQVLRPDAMPFLTAVLVFPITIVRYALIYLANLLWYALLVLLWGESQLSEYFADLLGARIGGTTASLDGLRKLPLGRVYDAWEYAARVDGTGATFFADLRSRFARVPEREYERLRRVQEASRDEVTTTHPPLARRQEFLRANYMQTPAYEPSPETLAQVESELLLLCQQAQVKMFRLAPPAA